MVDTKLRILPARKKAWGERAATVFPRQVKFGRDPTVFASNPPAHITVERIADLLGYSLPDLLGRNQRRLDADECPAPTSAMSKCASEWR